MEFDDDLPAVTVYVDVPPTLKPSAPKNNTAAKIITQPNKNPRKAIFKNL